MTGGQPPVSVRSCGLWIEGHQQFPKTLLRSLVWSRSQLFCLPAWWTNDDVSLQNPFYKWTSTLLSALFWWAVIAHNYCVKIHVGFRIRRHTNQGIDACAADSGPAANKYCTLHTPLSSSSCFSLPWAFLLEMYNFTVGRGDVAWESTKEVNHRDEKPVWTLRTDALLIHSEI